MYIDQYEMENSILNTPGTSNLFIATFRTYYSPRNVALTHLRTLPIFTSKNSQHILSKLPGYALVSPTPIHQNINSLKLDWRELMLLRKQGLYLASLGVAIYTV